MNDEERKLAVVFGRRFQEAIGKLTPGEVAWRLGLDEATVRRYLVGEQVPETEDAVAASRAFGVSVDYLIGRREEPRRPQRAELRREAAAPGVAEAEQFQRYLQYRMERGEVIDKADLKYLHLLRMKGGLLSQRAAQSL
ncbi:MAG: hypothetical protein Kow0025_20980 [Thermodesulfovibrionales bacterium]